MTADYGFVYLQNGLLHRGISERPFAFQLLFGVPPTALQEKARSQGICLSTYQWTRQLRLFTEPGLPWALFKGLRKDVPWLLSWRLE